MRKKMYLLVMVITLLSCGDDNDIVESFIKFDKICLNIDPWGGVYIVNISSNTKWSISEIPKWCSIVENRVSDSGFIEIEVLPNKTGQDRQGLIKLSGGSIAECISIHQKNVESEDEFAWATFPVNSFDNVTYTVGDDGVERNYNIQGTDFFINKFVYSKVYNGNLIDRNLESIHDLSEYNSYTYNPLTIACYINGKFFERTTKPSIEELVDFSNEICQAIPQQNQSFNFSNIPIKYTSYRQLHLLSKGNLGIKLDELLTGSSYRDNEMSNKVGYIFSYSMKLFNVMMDIPDKIIQEDIKDENILKTLSFINNITYGKTAYLIIECADNDLDIKNIIGKLFKKESLDLRENSIIENADSYYMHFDKVKNVYIEHGKLEVIRKYINSINETPIIPLSFSALNYVDYSISKINFKVSLP